MNRDRIVATAVDLLDREGAASLTMRKLAAELGVHATSLYWYVDRREDLIDLAVDEILRPAARARPPADKGWDAVVCDTARQMYTALTQHPWASAFVGWRPMVGPNALRLTGRIIAALVASGAAEADLPVAASAIGNLILGAVSSTTAVRAITTPDSESPLARRVVGCVAAMTPLPPSFAAWNVSFEEELAMLLDGFRARLPVGPDS